MSSNVSGESMWVEGVIGRNRRWLLVYFLSATGDYAKSEDYVQETFEIAYRKKDEYDKSYAFGAWLRGIARNILKGHFKQASKESLVMSWEAVEGLDEPVSELEMLGSDPEYREKRLAALRECVAILTQKTRSLLALHYVSNRPLKEIAEHMRTTVSNIGIILFRGRMALSACIARKMSQ
ncbi:MAG: RNA polymerase sigma factor [Kiritimatiellae bacterium]|nr:RNA polymerase sigma factor [Kiritimatiellia bacterium]